MRTNSAMKNITITSVTSNQIKEVLPYVIAFRQQLFPMLDPTIVPNDLVEFDQNYIISQTSLFLQARNNQNELVGVIGMMPYNYRFSDLNLKGKQIVEVARLFVEPSYRRKGLASMLFKTLEQEAINRGIDQLYLHTHPFLTGAYEYWIKQGFELMVSRDEQGFETLHLKKQISIANTNITQLTNEIHNQ